MVECEPRNKCSRDVCKKEIGLRLQNLLTILDAVVNLIEGGGGYMIIY